MACAVRKLKFAAEPIPIPSVQQTYQVSSGRKEYSGGWDGKSRDVQRVTKSGLSENHQFVIKTAIVGYSEFP